MKKIGNLKKSVILSGIYKPLGLVLSLIYTPVLLNYLGDESYGVWSTILSVVNWINYFDVGLGNGLRNQLSKAITIKDNKQAKSLSTTGYVVISLISLLTFIIGIFVISFGNVNSWFNTEINLRPALLISFSFVCVNFILSLSKSQLYAIQQADKVGLMVVITQALNLFFVWLITYFTESNLTLVAIIIGSSTFFVDIVFTLVMWKKHKELIPDVRTFDKANLSSIGKEGVQFFVIQIAALVLFSSDNLIITNILGPTSVTSYSMVYKAYEAVFGVFSSLTSPLWSRYTVALVNNDYKWIKEAIKKQFLLLIPFIFAITILGVFFKPIAKIWLGKDLDYDYGVVLVMVFYCLLQMVSNIFSTLANGMGRIKTQLIWSVISAVINIPLSFILGGEPCNLGTTGVALATVICMTISVIPIAVDALRFVNKNHPRVSNKKE